MGDNKRLKTPAATAQIEKGKNGTLILHYTNVASSKLLEWREQDMVYRVDNAHFVVASHPDGTQSWVWFGNSGSNGYLLLIPYSDEAVEKEFTFADGLEIYHSHPNPNGSPINELIPADSGKAFVKISRETWTVTGNFDATFKVKNLKPYGNFNIEM